METIWLPDPRSCDLDKTSACNSILSALGPLLGLELTGWLHNSIICWFSKMFRLERVCLQGVPTQAPQDKRECWAPALLYWSNKAQPMVKSALQFIASLTRQGEHPEKDVMKVWLQSTASLWTNLLKSRSAQRLNEAKPFRWPSQTLTSSAALYFHSDPPSHLYWRTLPFPLVVPQDDTAWSHLSLPTRSHSSSFPIPFCSLLASCFNPKVCFSLPISLFVIILFPHMQGSTPWYGWGFSSWTIWIP